MGYYRGDFYMGARGDPGFLSFVKGIGSSLASFIPGVGPIASKAIAAIPTPAKSTAITRVVQAAAPVIARGKALIKAHPALTAAGAAGATAAGGAILGRMSAGAPAAAGMASVGRMRGGGGHRRRMNPCNPRALRRAIRRTHSFAKLAMRTIKLVHPQKKARFGGFRKKKARK